MNIFHRKVQRVYTFQISKESFGEGGINMTQKFSGGSPCSPVLKIEDDISEPGSLRAVEMIGVCNIEVIWWRLNISSQVDTTR